MSESTAVILWQRAGDAVFTAQRSSRAHRWQFDGGIEVPASSSPAVVPLPGSVAAAVDPEGSIRRQRNFPRAPSRKPAGRLSTRRAACSHARR